MKVSILIPCHNEEKCIARCIESCINQTRRADQIVVVDDGSTDKTPKLLASFGSKITVVKASPNTGNKSLAQEMGLKRVTGDIVITVDADTLLDASFIENILLPFEDSNIVAVSGYVKSIPHNWLTACRQIEYTVGQDIYKTAQEFIGHILVMPGCASAFRTKTLKESVRFDHDTITEDLDFTYQIHALGGKIGFARSAVVYTQDPADIGSYFRQTTRWYRGGWQNLRKHISIAFNKPAAAFEMSLLYFEGILASLALMTAPLFIPFIFAEVIFGQMILLTILLGAYTAIRNKRWDVLIYSPIFSLLMMVNTVLVTKEFITTILLGQRGLVWLKATRISL